MLRVRAIQQMKKSGTITYRLKIDKRLIYFPEGKYRKSKFDKRVDDINSLLLKGTSVLQISKEMCL